MKHMFIIFIVLIFLIGCTNNYVKINNKKINVEIADEDDERAEGLMNREKLGKNSGMLFTYDDSKGRNFWMKNTLIPLDMIFIDEDLVIKKIRYAVPCKEDPCELYDSEVPVKYVLEVNGNYTKENDINEGDSIVISI
ncbi:MAG: DUF192 domain-containing protein [Nanoarchaeota archaeon]